MRVKEESENDGLKLNSQKTKIMAPSPITSWQIEGGKVEMVTDFIFLVGWHHRLNGHELSQLQEIVKDREDSHAAVHRVTKSWTQHSN